MNLTVASYNFGIDQSMLESTKKWNSTLCIKFRDVLSSLGQAAGNDFVFGSEVGGMRQGFNGCEVLDLLVQDAMPGAHCS